MKGKSIRINVGYIFDSCPLDFVSDMGNRFVLHQTGLKIPRPPLVASWITSGISSTEDALFLSRFEPQRTEYCCFFNATRVSGLHISSYARRMTSLLRFK